VQDVLRCVVAGSSSTGRVSSSGAFIACLEYDERNFHCWAYRYFLLERLCPDRSLSDAVRQFYQDELTFLRSTIGLNLSNYSAWHYRSKYLDKYVEHEPSSRATLLSAEWQLVLSAVYTDCSDQAAWFYARWLLFKQLGAAAIDEHEHVRPLEELNELEPRNKWCMLMLVQLWKDREHNNERRRTFLEQLADDIDPDRAQFYRDQI
jgi:geranylgeranyl transferase type-2 subunit alpha